MSKLKCVLFDFDGVIADTEYSNLNYYALAMRSVGVELTEEEKLSLLGANDDETAPRFLRRAPVPVTTEEFRLARKRVGNTYENSDIAPYPGLRELLTDLRGAGILTGVVSSTECRLVLTALNRMRMLSLFDVVVGGDMTMKHKPDPCPYQHAMRLLNAEPAETVVIEDSATGIRAGLAAGATVIGYTGGSIRQDVSAASMTAQDYFSLAGYFRDILKR